MTTGEGGPDAARAAASRAERGATSSEGDPHEILAQHRALSEAAALLDPGRVPPSSASPPIDRRVVQVVGERALAMIHGLVTNTTDPVRTGSGVYAFALTPKGRPVAELRVLPRPDGPGKPGSAEGGCWLDTPSACADALVAHLARYVPPRFATVEPADRARLSVVGPRAVDALVAASGPDAPALPGAEELRALRPLETRGVALAGGEAGLLVRREPIEGDGFDLYVPGDAADAVGSALRTGVDAAGGRVAGPEAFEIFRVERGLPVYGREIGEDNLPQETGQTGRAVDFAKGCYTGQEVVARIHYRGRVNRNLRGLRGAGDELPGGGGTSGAGALPPERGHPLFDGDRAVGELRTAVRSPVHGSIGLGYVRREIAPGATLATRAGGAATVEVLELPFTET